MVGVVFSPILPFSLEPRTHLEPQIGRDRDISEIEQLMKVGAQKYSITDLVGALQRVRLNVSRLENRKRFLTRNRTAAGVSVGHQHPERSLPQATAR